MAFLGVQLIVSTAFNDAAFVQQADLVGMFDRAQPL